MKKLLPLLIFTLFVASCVPQIQTQRQEAPQNWKAKTLWESEEKIQRVIVADIDPEHSGDEIISVASNGEVVYIYESADQWANDILWVDTESLTGAAVGELDAAHPGREIIVGGEKGQLEFHLFLL